MKRTLTWNTERDGNSNESRRWGAEKEQKVESIELKKEEMMMLRLHFFKKEKENLSQMNSGSWENEKSHENRDCTIKPYYSILSSAVIVSTKYPFLSFFFLSPHALPGDTFSWRMRGREGVNRAHQRLQSFTICLYYYFLLLTIVFGLRVAKHRHTHCWSLSLSNFWHQILTQCKARENEL